MVHKFARRSLRGKPKHMYRLAVFLLLSVIVQFFERSLSGAVAVASPWGPAQRLWFVSFVATGSLCSVVGRLGVGRAAAVERVDDPAATSAAAYPQAVEVHAGVSGEDVGPGVTSEDLFPDLARSPRDGLPSVDHDSEGDLCQWDEPEPRSPHRDQYRGTTRRAASGGVDSTVAGQVELVSYAATSPSQTSLQEDGPSCKIDGSAAQSHTHSQNRGSRSQPRALGPEDFETGLRAAAAQQAGVLNSSFFEGLTNVANTAIQAGFFDASEFGFPYGASTRGGLPQRRWSDGGMYCSA
eukprot:gene122-40_t